MATGYFARKAGPLSINDVTDSGLVRAWSAEGMDTLLRDAQALHASCCVTRTE